MYYYFEEFTILYVTFARHCDPCGPATVARCRFQGTSVWSHGRQACCWGGWAVLL